MKIVYLFFLTIIPFLFIPDVYAATTAELTAQDTRRSYFTSALDGVDCGETSTTGNDPSSLQFGSDAGDSCYLVVTQFPLSSIPNWAEIAKVELELDWTIGGGFDEDCGITPVTVDLTTATHEQVWDNVRANSNSTAYIDSDTLCHTTDTDVRYDLGNQAVTDLQGNLTDGFFRIGFIEDNGQGSGTNQLTTGTNINLYVTYSDQAFGVQDLVITDVRGTGVDLSWSTPSSNLTITGYQINYTTPWNENVATVAQNDTESNSVNAVVNQLTGETQYSFRVGVYTTGGLNATGNVANTTTLFDPTKAFTPGTFNVTDVGTDLRDIRFEEINLSATSKQLNITFPDTFTNFKCDLSYEFALVNKTYENMDSNADPDNPGYNETSFVFTDVDNEIITANCWNDTDGNGTYTITQTSIPFVNQIKQFQAGDFGTAGDFGAIDLVTLLVFGAIATLGFNRKNEAVGAFFLFALTFGLAWFEIITIPTAMAGVVAVVILLVIVQVRKD